MINQKTPSGFQPLRTLFAQMRSNVFACSCHLFLHSSLRNSVRGYSQSAGSCISVAHFFQSSSFAVCHSSASRVAFHSTSGFFMSLSIRSARVAQMIRLVVIAKSIPPIKKYLNIIFLSCVPVRGVKSLTGI